MGQLVGAVKKEELASAGKEMAEQVTVLLQQEILQLKSELRELKCERAQLDARFHAEHARAQALAERVAAADARADLLSRFDGLLTIFIALGGGIAGLGISWPDLLISFRVVLASIGFALILLPAGFKLTGRARSPTMPSVRPLQNPDDTKGTTAS